MNGTPLPRLRLLVACALLPLACGLVPSFAFAGIADPHAAHRAAATGSAQAAQDPHAAHRAARDTPTTDPHTGHVMPETSGNDADPHAHHSAPATPATDPHAGHAMPEAPADDADPRAHHGHAGAAAQSADPHAHHAASPFPTPTAEERAAAFPAELEDMDMSDHMDDDPRITVFHGDRLETARDADLRWDLRLGTGGTFDKVWLRSEGERDAGTTAHARTELYWSHATGPWWDRTLGLRHDTGGGDPSRTWVGIGVQGLLPHFIETEATLYAGERGLAARVEFEYELLLTNQLILQPKVEANLYGRDDVDRHIGRGLSDVEAGLRLRYEFSPRFAPYVGYTWTRSFGRTADLLRDAGDGVQDDGWVAGVRFWF